MNIDVELLNLSGLFALMFNDINHMEAENQNKHRLRVDSVKGVVLIRRHSLKHPTG